MASGSESDDSELVPEYIDPDPGPPHPRNAKKITMEEAKTKYPDQELAQKLVDQSQPQQFFQEVVDLLSWRHRAEGQEHIQATVNQVFSAHPTALLSMYLDWRRVVAAERTADALEGQA